MLRASSARSKMPKVNWGGPQFEARKYRAWEHHLALTAAVLWFAVLTKLESERECRRDIRIALEMGVGAAGTVDGKHPRVDAGSTAAGAAHAGRGSAVRG